MKKHNCKYEKIPSKFEVRFFDPGVYAFEEAMLHLSLLFKGQKKAKKIMQCRICGKYAIECPYCHKNVELDFLPLETTCSYCNKKIRIRIY